MANLRQECTKYTKAIEICTKSSVDADILDYVFSELMNKFGFDITDVNKAYDKAVNYCCNSF